MFCIFLWGYGFGLAWNLVGPQSILEEFFNKILVELCTGNQTKRKEMLFDQQHRNQSE
jgi:hypothetical protein